MAENKKSFLLYTNYKEYIDVLTDEQAGQWTKWVFDYCNDKWLNKEIEYPKDTSVKMLCMLVKDTLKRDLKKYEERLERLKKNGKQYRNEVDTKSKKKKTDIDTEVDTEVGRCNMLIDNCNMLNDISKDINNIVSKDTCGEVSQEKPTPLIILPCLSNYNHPIFEEDIKHYKELYPAVDILQELKKMLGWLESNPSNRKTKNGIKAFITRWLSKVQDKAPKVESQNVGFGEYDVVGGFQRLGESDEEYEKRTGIKRYNPKKRNFDDPDGFGGNVL